MVFNKLRLIPISFVVVAGYSEDIHSDLPAQSPICRNLLWEVASWSDGWINMMLRMRLYSKTS